MKYIQVLPKYRTARTKPIIYNHGKFVMHYAYNSRRKHAVPKAKKYIFTCYAVALLIPCAMLA